MKPTNPEFLRAYADMKQAEGLLRDKSLVWSNDFDTIRVDLADLLRYEAAAGHFANRNTLNIARTLINDEFEGI